MCCGGVRVSAALRRCLWVAPFGQHSSVCWARSDAVTQAACTAEARSSVGLMLLGLCVCIYQDSFFWREMPSAACLPVLVLLITIGGICGCQAVICRAANPTYVYTSCPDAAAAALCAGHVLHRCVCTVCV